MSNTFQWLLLVIEKNKCVKWTGHFCSPQTEIERNHMPANYISHATQIHWMEIHLYLWCPKHQKFLFGCVLEFASHVSVSWLPKFIFADSQIIVWIGVSPLFKNTTPLFLVKPPLKLASCPSPSFLGNPPSVLIYRPPPPLKVRFSSERPKF